MWYDRDIDAKMKRTRQRPIPSGQVAPDEVLRIGLLMSVIGIAWALALNPLYGLIVFAGLFFDVVVYSVWLKRRSPWSIIWGGIAGGMPVLAGRVLGIGEVDWVGIALSLAVLLWIPTHIMTFTMRYAKDYEHAGVPTFPTRYGPQATRTLIAVSSVFAALSMGVAAYGVGMTWGYLRLLAVLSLGLLSLAMYSMYRPSWKANFGLFKYASLYMLSSMVLLVVEAI
jgi:protoheme IX farnesyltransferase